MACPDWNQDMHVRTALSLIHIYPPAMLLCMHKQSSVCSGHVGPYSSCTVNETFACLLSYRRSCTLLLGLQCRRLPPAYRACY